MEDSHQARENEASASSQPGPPQTDASGCSGRFIIIVCFVTGIALAGFAAWFRYHQQRRCKEFWGPEVNKRIIKAPRVELWKLVDDPKGAQNPDTDVQDVDGKLLVIANRRRVEDVRAIKDVRKALVRDDFFDWEKPRGDCQGKWEYALFFAEKSGQTVLYFDFECQRVRLADSKKEVSIAPMAKKVKGNFDSQFPKGSKPAKKKEPSGANAPR